MLRPQPKQATSPVFTLRMSVQPSVSGWFGNFTQLPVSMSKEPGGPALVSHTRPTSQERLSNPPQRSPSWAGFGGLAKTSTQVPPASG
ncbi:MAG TPA: hypothetical protein HA252_06340 [Candidatus Diapherotrites archaeon]|uniref:Uncharacterized protein n=1 Tax=Candidatus Iainarchaeum sp. TaxID=3101447 RepID=A0A7J4JP71_9ARCH|nr:hypothetical protein [Candidatus Diapherotrites archaeon]